MKKEEVLIILGFLLFIQGYIFENVFPAVLGFSVVLYLIYLRNSFFPHIDVKWDVGRVLVEGEKSVSRIKLKNRSKIGLRISLSSDSLPLNFKSDPKIVVLKGEEEKTVDFVFVPSKGKYRIKGPKLTIYDLRGLYQETFTDSSEIEIEVVPSFSKIREEIIADENVRLAGEYKKFLVGVQTMELHSLRRFQPGDDTKYIEWKATARLGEIIVKDFLKEVEEDVYLILDAGREMRKGMKRSRIDYAITLSLYLSKIMMKNYRVGLIVYDDYRVLHKIWASKSSEHIQKILRALTISPIEAKTFGLKIPEFATKISSEGREFIKRIVPVLKGRKGALNGILEVISHIPNLATLIFIADITSQTSDLAKILVKLKQKHRVFLLTPNPILFYDVSDLDKDVILYLYGKYIERENLVKKFNRIVPTFDLGPSDLSEVIRGVLE